MKWEPQQETKQSPNEWMRLKMAFLKTILREALFFVLLDDKS